MKNCAIYPGTFDPITYGHLDILERSSFIFEKIILAISETSSKKLMFDIDERIFLAKTCSNYLKNIEIIKFNGLTAYFAKKNNVNVLIRSVRSFLDFEYEYNLSIVNKIFFNSLETVFLFPSSSLSFISSSFIKKIAKYTNNIYDFLPKIAADAILEKVNDIDFR